MIINADSFYHWIRGNSQILGLLSVNAPACPANRNGQVATGIQPSVISLVFGDFNRFSNDSQKMHFYHIEKLSILAGD